MYPAVALALAVVAVPSPSVQLAPLARHYRAFDLPLPPPDAKLYHFTIEHPPRGHKPPVPPDHEFGFALAADEKGHPTKVLNWLIEDDSLPNSATHTSEVRRSDKWPRPLKVSSDELVLAAQCELLGWHDLAEAALEKWRAYPWTIPDAEQYLATRAWNHWVRQFHQGADRAKVARRLTAIAAVLTPPPEDPFLTNLNLSLKPSGAKAGTPEAAIDDLMDVSEVRDNFGSREGEDDPRLQAVFRHGFDAVPALIAHLDDDRLTRTYQLTDGFITHHGECYHDYSVKHFARNILFRYMGAKDATMHVSKGTMPDTDVVKKWWAEAKEVGEEAYLFGQLWAGSTNALAAHDQFLAAIEAKYPERLPDVFATLKKADTQRTRLDPFVDALFRSPLPAADQKKHLLDMLASAEHEWQASALKGLHRLDADEFHTRLIAAFADLPRWEDKAKREDLRSSFYTCFADVAGLTADAKVWAAVGKYLDETTAEVKIEWIDHLTWFTPSENVGYAKAMGAVAALLADESVRVRKNGEDVTVTVVRNHAAKRLGEALNVPGEPSENASAEGWEKFRNDVAKAAKAIQPRR